MTPDTTHSSPGTADDDVLSEIGQHARNSLRHLLSTHDYDIGMNVKRDTRFTVNRRLERDDRLVYVSVTASGHLTDIELTTLREILNTDDWFLESVVRHTSTTEEVSLEDDVTASSTTKSTTVTAAKDAKLLGYSKIFAGSDDPLRP